MVRRFRSTIRQNRGRKVRFYCGLPSLRTGRADLPHPALRLMGPFQGLTGELMGRS